jgi:hypothetical protein
MESGDFILGAFGGYFKFSPLISRRTNKPQNVLITSFFSGNREILFEQQLLDNHIIRLSPDENLFTIEFASLNYTNPGEIRYEYRLKDLEQNWKEAERRGFAGYTHLKGGNYTFEVRAVNSEGQYSDITAVPVFIGTPFYKTWWFNLAVSLIFSAIIFFIYQMRIRNVEKTEALKTKFNKQLAETEMRALRAQMNPHFIFNCLNSINRYIIKNDHKTASLYLTKFAKLIRLILDNSETHEVALSQELEALKLYIDIEALRFDHKFSYEIIVDENINTEAIQVPPMIIQPFVENAIWHGLLHKETPGRLKLKFYIEQEMLVCEIEDNGIGREKAGEMKSKSATTRKSLGLKITSDRLSILNERTSRNGGISFIDLKEKDGSVAGTRVVVKMPVDVE